MVEEEDYSLNKTYNKMKTLNVNEVIEILKGRFQNSENENDYLVFKRKEDGSLNHVIAIGNFKPIKEEDYDNLVGIEGRNFYVNHKKFGNTFFKFNNLHEKDLEYYLVSEDELKELLDEESMNIIKNDVFDYTYSEMSVLSPLDLKKETLLAFKCEVEG